MVRSLPRFYSIWISYICWRSCSSTHRLHSSRNWWWILNILRICRNSNNSKRSWCWYVHSVWICNSNLYQSGWRGYSTLRPQGCFCNHEASLVISSYNIWSYYTFWCWRYQRNSDIRILRRRQRSWHIRNYYSFQHSSCSSICRLYAFNWYWQRSSLQCTRQQYRKESLGSSLRNRILQKSCQF